METATPAPPQAKIGKPDFYPMTQKIEEVSIFFPTIDLVPFNLLSFSVICSSRLQINILPQKKYDKILMNSILIT